MKSLYKAKSIKDVIAIIEPSTLAKIPKDKLKDIAENILCSKDILGTKYL